MAATTTTRRNTRCTKHAFAPRAAIRPGNDVTEDVTLPGQGHIRAHTRSGSASGTSVAGNDPVINSDPSGLAPIQGSCSGVDANPTINPDQSLHCSFDIVNATLSNPLLAASLAGNAEYESGQYQYWRLTNDVQTNASGCGIAQWTYLPKRYDNLVAQSGSDPAFTDQASYVGYEMQQHYGFFQSNSDGLHLIQLTLNCIIFVASILVEEECFAPSNDVNASGNTSSAADWSIIHMPGGSSTTNADPDSLYQRYVNSVRAWNLGTGKKLTPFLFSSLQDDLSLLSEVGMGNVELPSSAMTTAYTSNVCGGSGIGASADALA